MRSSPAEGKRLEFYLKKEIEEYRNGNKQFASRKDMMIKMLIEEVDKQHLRINYLEGKVKDYKCRILKLEDAL